jgi:hypothetical protein
LGAGVPISRVAGRIPMSFNGDMALVPKSRLKSA